MGGPAGRPAPPRSVSLTSVGSRRNRGAAAPFWLGMARLRTACRAGQGDLELETSLGQAATRQLGQASGRRPAELGLQGVVQTQLETPAEVLAEAGAQLGPAVGGQDEVDAVVQADGGELGDLRLQLGQLTDERAPVVDQQEDLAVAAEVEPTAA